MVVSPGLAFSEVPEHIDLDEITVGPSVLRARPQVRLPDEAGHEDRRRPIVDLGRAADLVHVARVHDRDAVTHRQRFLLVVGDVDERDADLALNSLELELHHLAKLEVERAERFVQQQRAGVVHQCAGQRHTLLLTAGELGRLALREVGEPDDLEQFVDAPLDLGLVLLHAARSVRDVVPHRHVREQCVVLEHGVDVALVRGHP